MRESVLLLESSDDIFAGIAESSSNIRDSLRERPTSAEQQSAADGAGSEGASTSQNLQESFKKNVVIEI